MKADLEKALQEKSRAVKQKEELEAQLAGLTKKLNVREETAGSKKAARPFAVFERLGPDYCRLD